MLEQIDLSAELSKSDYKARLPELQAELLELQRAYWRAGLASVLVFDGWDFAGKGRAISKLTERLEPRGFRVEVIRQLRTHNRLYPRMWRYWQRLPAYGEMAIFYGSWYARALLRTANGDEDEAAIPRILEEFNDFERALADDRYVLQKFFLHIDEREQKRRYKAAKQDPFNRWKVDERHRDRVRRYADHRELIEQMIARTDSEWAPWTLVAATDHRWVRIVTMERIAETLRRGLRERGLEVPTVVPEERADAAQ